MYLTTPPTPLYDAHQGGYFFWRPQRQSRQDRLSAYRFPFTLVGQPDQFHPGTTFNHLDEKIFCSLFHHLSVVRNTAAHHSRLWNRKFVVTFQLPKKKPQHLWPNFSTCRQQGTGRERNLYNTLVLLVHLIQCIEPAGDWPQRLVNHLGTLDSALQPDMGCPANWRELPLWKPLAIGGGAL